MFNKSIFRSKIGKDKRGIWSPDKSQALLQLDTNNDGKVDPDKVEGTPSGALPLFTFKHTQDVAASIWNVNHGVGVVQPAHIQLYNDSGESIIATVTPVDDENLTVDFNTLMVAGCGYFSFILE